MIAGKGRHLNSINQIMTKNKFRIEDWARVRFGAGTPWRRCWCVIEPPDEKEWQKSQKRMGKRSAYDKVVYPKGDIKFYDTKKIKKATPIATITDAYSAYAIYPQSKPLINESTLVKLEGKITIHSQPESKTEGFVFVMPEVHPAVSGFEIMLRWLLPVYDTFNLYGRPTRLIPDVMDTKSLMFAMPKERRYGYLDIIDIATLIHTDGSDKWTEREWRKKMKESVLRRMSMQQTGRASNLETVRDPTNSRQSIQFSDATSLHKQNMSTDAVFEAPKKTFTAPAHINHHSRSVSENINMSPRKARELGKHAPSRLSEEHSPPSPPAVSFPARNAERHPLRPRINDAGYMDSANSSDSDMQGYILAEDVERDMIQPQTVQPVATPPDFQHQPNEQPKRKPIDRPEMRREKSRMSDATLSQMNPRVLDEIRREDAARSQHMQETYESGPAASAAARAWNQNRHAMPGMTNGVHHNYIGVGETETPADAYDGILANTQRPAILNYPTSSSIPFSVERKPLAVSKHSQLHNATRPTIDRAVSETSNYSMPSDERDQSPDYASHYSVEVPKAKERIRGGTRKTVGDPSAEQPADADNIHIDFGQTLRLDPSSRDTSTSRPNSRPGTAGGRRSPFDSLGRPTSASGRCSPFDVLTPSTGRKSPLNPFESSSPARTPEKQSPIDRPSHSRSNSYAWQPGFHLNDSKEGLSAEEFVQQRAAMAMRPQGYVQQRTLSSGRLNILKSEETSRPSSPTSPRKLQKRHPSSRQSSGQSIDFSSHLSAREQEHVARVTGGPLLSNVNQQRTPDPNVGLIGAIGAREQEKRGIKEGLQGRMVQAAIDQRQREVRNSQLYQAQSDQRRQSQHMMLPTQQYASYPAASEYAVQSMQGPWPSAQHPNPQPQPMYGLQSQQSQFTQLPPQFAYQSASQHQRMPSSYSQYAGYYTPRG